MSVRRWISLAEVSTIAVTRVASWEECMTWSRSCRVIWLPSRAQKPWSSWYEARSAAMIDVLIARYTTLRARWNLLLDDCTSPCALARVSISSTSCPTRERSLIASSVIWSSSSRSPSPSMLPVANSQMRGSGSWIVLTGVKPGKRGSGSWIVFA